MISVVTDLPHTRDELLPLIESRGYQATHLDCADDVPERTRAQRPALLIIDCGVRDSFSLVTRMRADPRTQSIPLIMFTTSDETLRGEAMARGADAFVRKQSLDWAELLEQIVRLAGSPPRAQPDSGAM